MAFNESLVIGGLNSETVAIPAAGVYVLKGKIALPRLAAGSSAPSSAVMTITNNTGPVTLYTGSAGLDGFYLDTVCAAGDSITFAVTSAAAVDAGNAVKSVIAVSSGV